MKYKCNEDGDHEIIMAAIAEIRKDSELMCKPESRATVLLRNGDREDMIESPHVLLAIDYRVVDEGGEEEPYKYAQVTRVRVFRDTADGGINAVKDVLSEIKMANKDAFKGARES